jgi:hypothetical protein
MCGWQRSNITSGEAVRGETTTTAAGPRPSVSPAGSLVAAGDASPVGVMPGFPWNCQETQAAPSSRMRGAATVAGMAGRRILEDLPAH